MSDPTQNGWYWGREHEDSTWDPHYVNGDFWFDLCGNMRDFDEVHEWGGPLPPRDSVVELEAALRRMCDEVESEVEAKTMIRLLTTCRALLDSLSNTSKSG